MTPSQHSQHPVGDTRRQWVGPLVNSLVGDADSLGGEGFRAPEQIDGARFEHALLNHGSGIGATIVFVGSPTVETMVAGSYGLRLKTAMGIPADGSMPRAAEIARIRDLAEGIGVTFQAIDKIFRDGSNAMSAENNSKAAAFLKVDPDWLATGSGTLRSQRVWPFGDAVTPEQFFALDTAAMRPVLDLLLAAVARVDADGDNPSTGSSAGADKADMKKHLAELMRNAQKAGIADRMAGRRTSAPAKKKGGSK